MQAFKVCCWTLKIWMIQLALVLSIQAQDCSRPTGGPNMVLSDSFINRDTFTNGEQVSFVCSTGFVSAGGSRSITCTDGVWSEVKMKCKIRSCGSPGEILNGHFEFPDGIEFGATVHTKCDVGYILVGSGVRTCMSQGWSGRVPICEAVMCGPPPDILNGGLVTPPGEEYKFGDVVVYTCQKEFTMNGTSSIRCSENGEFQPSPPTCISRTWDPAAAPPGFSAQNCSRPKGGPSLILSDSFIYQDTFTHGASVYFVCSTGYVGAGGSRWITCTDGVWSEVKLKCKKRLCGSPGDILNGQYDLSEGIEFGARVYAKCNKGYTLVGSGERTCMSQGWSGRVPTCEAVMCGPPPDILNGGLVTPLEEEYKYGDVVVYTCQKEFTMNGSSSISCSENGEFQPSPPTCISFSAQNCSRPKGGPSLILSDSFIYQDTFTHGASVYFVCSTGYVGAGGSRWITCTDGVWSEVKLKCKKRLCGSPGDILNGQYDLSEGIEFGARVYAKCNKGYTLVGSGERTCMSQGWSGRVPTCEEISCPTPVVKNGVRFEGGPPPYKHLSSVTFRCNSGYEMNGQATLTCEMNGWSADVPSCIAGVGIHVGEERLG
ncbi:complement receptor type 1-like isoform X3 [Esox lucius]|uniref:complement receptor type 1-like isoform X3 n=1 Tax=Esox lucius TaxID=8010 RepID=UPI001476A839|nr:complement receptor type 1-like isoform X3 [Esox lucius]